jgi:hypothetical protein
MTCRGFLRHPQIAGRPSIAGAAEPLARDFPAISGRCDDLCASLYKSGNHCGAAITCIRGGNAELNRLKARHDGTRFNQLLKGICENGFTKLHEPIRPLNCKFNSFSICSPARKFLNVSTAQ